jgi:GAF domain-containing protein
MWTPHRQLLAEAGRAFSAAFDPDIAPWNVVRFLVPRLADWALVGHVLGDGSIRRMAHAHVDSAAAARLSTMTRFMPARRGAEYLDAVARVLRSGRQFVIPDVSERPELLPAGLEVAGTRALLVAPLRPRCQRRPSGVMILGAQTAGRFGPDEARLASALALRAGIVFEVAQRVDDMRAQGASPPAASSSRRRRRGPEDRAGQRAELTRRLMAEV